MKIWLWREVTDRVIESICSKTEHDHVSAAQTFFFQKSSVSSVADVNNIKTLCVLGIFNWELSPNIYIFRCLKLLWQTAEKLSKRHEALLLLTFHLMTVSS
jgi:hypothetical protein